MIDVTEVHAQVIIAFSLVMIVVLLAYMAFFKESDKKHDLRRSRHSA